MYPTANQVGAVVAAMLKRSGQTRARISALTIRKIARRKTLRSAFIRDLSDALSEGYGWLFVELATGGFGVVEARALEAAKPVTGNKQLSEDERRALVRGKAKYETYHSEAVGEDEGDEELD